MGGSPYFYFVPYEKDYNTALQKLREREFNAGRYYPAVMMPEFPITENTRSPGAQHGSIEEAIEAGAEEGTASILDLHSVSESSGFCVARILDTDELEFFFDTDKPAREQAMSCDELFEDVERGTGVVFPVYENGQPVELFFMGYSID